MSTFDGYFQAALNTPYWLVAIGVCLACGYAIRRLRPEWKEAIPLICLLVAAILTMFLAPPAPITAVAWRWRLLNFSIGAVLGLIAWLAHKLLLKKLEAKYPWIKDFLDGMDGTDFLAKKDVPPDPPKP